MKEIVIKIPEDVYTRLFDNGIQDNEIAVDDVCEMARAIRLGTELPKGHGRLIDVDELEECKEIMQLLSGECKYSIRMDDIRNMTPIVKADKEYEVEVVTRGNCMMCGKELTEGLFFCKGCEAKQEDKKVNEAKDEQLTSQGV